MTLKTKLFRLEILLVAACLLSGCAATKRRSPRQVQAGRTIRNNCYSLLHQLLEQEKHVSLLRFIKDEKSDVNALIRRISAATAAGAKMLEGYAAEDDSISLEDTWLPPGEAATREAIAASTRSGLLHESGRDFELRLLITQTQALNYGANLSKVAAENESQVSRSRSLLKLSGELQGLNQDVLRILLSRGN
jgi:hypothetical protein